MEVKSIATLKIYLSSIKDNISKIKENLHGQKFCFVAKANCYGLGSKQICKFVDRYVDQFAVSCESEFNEIKSLTTKPILILDPLYKNLKKTLQNGAEITISNTKNLQEVINLSKANPSLKIKVHLSYNTGMNRFGFNTPCQIKYVYHLLSHYKNISVVGIFSHYFDSELNLSFSSQTRKFNNLKRYLEKNKILIPCYHLSNSVGAINSPKFDMVRVGMSCYSDKFFETINLSAKIIEIQHLKRGDSAGYNMSFVAKSNVKIATLNIGYGDGIFRCLAKLGYVLIGDNFCKVVAVCMDSILVDITSVSCKLGDTAILIGKSKLKQIFICDMASWCDTIDYEIITHLSKRVERKYISR